MVESFVLIVSEAEMMANAPYAMKTDSRLPSLSCDSPKRVMLVEKSCKSMMGKIAYL